MKLTVAGLDDLVICIFQLHSESFKLRRRFNGGILSEFASSSLRVKEGILCVEGVRIIKRPCFCPVMWKVLQEFLMSMLMCG